MTDRLADSVARPRLNAVLLSIFAGVALVLAVSGVGSVISYTVSQRKRETGVRMAFGATSSDIIKLVLRDGFQILAWGLALGGLASVGLSRYLRSVLYVIEPFDPLTFVVVATVLAVAVVLASAIPARRASRTDAVDGVALRIVLRLRDGIAFKIRPSRRYFRSKLEPTISSPDAADTASKGAGSRDERASTSSIWAK